MRLMIEARVEGIDGVTQRDGVVSLAVIEQHDLNVSDLGLTLSEGRALLAKLQVIIVSQQVASWMSGEMACRRCGLALAHKDSRTIMLRTVFGKVPLWSPRFWSCRCGVAAGAARRSVSPLCKALPTRFTSELQYLQAKWAAYLPYRQATNLLKEVLPLDTGISASDTRRKVGIIGKHLDAEVERDIVNLELQLVDSPVRESADVACVSVDSSHDVARWVAETTVSRTSWQVERRLRGGHPACTRTYTKKLGRQAHDWISFSLEAAWGQMSG